jgi:hypothetical protein
MKQAELALVIGFAVSLVVQILKRVWPGLNTSDALVKQITATVLASVAVLAAAQWHFNEQVFWQMLLTAVAALASHKVLLKTDPTPALTPKIEPDPDIEDGA